MRIYYIILALLPLTYRVASDDAYIASPSTWRNYTALRACAKWCLTGCRKQPQDNCTTSNVPPKIISAHSDYTGFVSTLGCDRPGCLCPDEVFSRSVEVIAKCLEEACTTDFTELSDEDYTSVVSVFGNYCHDMHFNPVAFPSKPLKTNPVNDQGTSPSTSGTITPDGKLALKLGLGMGIPTLICTMVGAYVSVVTLKRKIRSTSSKAPAGQLPVENSSENRETQAPPSNPEAPSPSQESSPQEISSGPIIEMKGLDNSKGRRKLEP